MSETFSRWDSADYLDTEEDVRAYLDACVSEDPGDGSLIAKALGTIARARNVSRLSRDAGMSREGIYKALSGVGNPSFATIMKVTQALGLQLRIQ